MAVFAVWQCLQCLQEEWCPVANREGAFTRLQVLYDSGAVMIQVLLYGESVCSAFRPSLQLSFAPPAVEASTVTACRRKRVLASPQDSGALPTLTCNADMHFIQLNNWTTAMVRD